jgi:hypothetical protein
MVAGTAPDMTIRSLTAPVLLSVLALVAASAQNRGLQTVSVDIPIAVASSEQRGSISGKGQLVLTVNAATLRRVILSPEDVVNASLKIAILNPGTSGSILVYRMHPALPGNPKSTDFGPKPMTTLAMSALVAKPGLPIGVKTGEISGFGDALRKALIEPSEGLPLLLVAQTAGSNQNLSLDMHDTVMNVTLVSYPKADLFTPSVRPRDGVYAHNLDGHLYYGDQRLRIWGCVRPQVPNVETADRIANMGFNAIRMWGPRANDAPKGISALIDDNTGEFVPSVRGDGSPLDEYDRFFAAAKRDGLFIMATGLTDIAHVTSKSEWLRGDGQNWTEWQKAMSSKPDDWTVNFMAAVDDRLFRARQQQVKDYLTHVNPYTGKNYAHEEAIAIYELANENAHIKRTMEKGFDKWPSFFVSELQEHWNQWLTKRYHDDASLVGVWTKLEVNESLTTGTVKLEPVVAHRDNYSAQRGSDFIRFLIEIDGSLNKRIEEYARSFAPEGIGVAVIPFSDDTQYMPSNAWLFDNTQNGDVANFGMYFWSLQDPLVKPPGMYVMDSNTVEGRITAIYETMDGRPDPYRAAYPYRLAALAGWEDWDAIFFHYWDGFHVKGRAFSDEDYLAGTLSYIAPTHYWTSVYYEQDPALLSPMAIAGQMFTHGALQPAPHPLTYVLGAKSIFDLSALGGESIARATYSQGAHIRFESNSDSAITIEGNPPKDLGVSPGTAVAMGDSVLWDWPNGRLIIDTPTAKAYIGKPLGKYRFKDGIVVGGFYGSFVSFGMISTDGKPLTGPEATTQIYISAANDAKNTGYHIRFNEATDPMPTGGPLGIGKLIANNGTSPIITDRVPYRIWFPTNFSGQFKGYDLARRLRITKNVSDGYIEHDGSELYLASLSIGNPGTRVIPTPQADYIKSSTVTANDSDRAASPTTSSRGVSLLWNPLPGVKWTENISGIEPRLRAANVKLDAVTRNSGSLHIATTDAIFHSISEINVIFAAGQMISIDATFTQPPALAAIISEYDRRFGPAIEKNIAVSEDKVSTVRWMSRENNATLTISLTETQGTVEITYAISSQ